MNKSLLFILLLFPFVGVSQITLDQTDDFESFTTANWTKGNNSNIPNLNIADGGPQGAGDNFLRVESTGGSGADSKLVTFNNAQWTGNYISAGVTYISMFVRNSGTNVVTLRLTFKRLPTSVGCAFSSITPIAVIPGEGWKEIIFPIDQSSLIKIDGNCSYSQLFSFAGSGVEELRILHNDVPDENGDPIVAIIDFDNIRARDENLNIIDFESIRKEIKITPNPASDIINISGISEKESYEIFDITGKSVKKGEVDSNYNEIDVNYLTKGFYLVKMQSGNTLKLIKD